METNAKIKPLNKQDNEEFKQETLEEVAERYGKQVLDERKSKNLLIDEEIWLSGGSIVGFIDGAKWQEDMADKKYTEEDMILFAFDTYHYISGIMKVPFNKVSENRTHAEENLKEFIKNNKQD